MAGHFPGSLHMSQRVHSNHAPIKTKANLTRWKAGRIWYVPQSCSVRKGHFETSMHKPDLAQTLPIAFRNPMFFPLKDTAYLNSQSCWNWLRWCFPLLQGRGHNLQLQKLLYHLSYLPTRSCDCTSTWLVLLELKQKQKSFLSQAVLFTSHNLSLPLNLHIIFRTCLIITVGFTFFKKVLGTLSEFVFKYSLPGCNFLVGKDYGLLSLALPKCKAQFPS